MPVGRAGTRPLAPTTRKQGNFPGASEASAGDVLKPGGDTAAASASPLEAWRDERFPPAHTGLAALSARCFSCMLASLATRLTRGFM